jgi:hypothetical protein
MRMLCLYFQVKKFEEERKKDEPPHSTVSKFYYMHADYIYFYSLTPLTRGDRGPYRFAVVHLSCCYP